MTPYAFSAIPAALKSAEARAMLDTEIEDFLGTSGLSRELRQAVETVAMILGVEQVRGLCSGEADQLFRNRFPPAVANRLRECLWDWLLDFVEDDEPGAVPFASGVYAGPYRAQPRPPLSPHESLPPIEAPPAGREALEQWAERHGVRERLADRLDVQRYRRVFYGLHIDGLPATIGEAVVLVPQDIRAPAYARRELASEIVAQAKAYLHRAATALAITRRRQAERAARARRPEDPFVARLADLVACERDRMAAQASPRADGTYLRGAIYLEREPPTLTYREWQISDARTPGTADEPTVAVHLGAWDTGELPLDCLRCQQSICAHRVTALDHLWSLLCDPLDPLPDALAPMLRVPGWSRMLDRLDSGLAQLAPVEEPGQRLIWEIAGAAPSLLLLPVLQKLRKRGAWSRGQRLRLDDLGRRPDLLRDAADRGAHEGLTGSRDSSNFYYDVNRMQSPRQLWRGLLALAGTERVFAAPARSAPISVRRVRPALAVDAAEGGFRLRLALGPHPIEPAALLAAAKDGRHVVWLDREHGRCLLALLEPETRVLLSAMASYGGLLPAEAVAELVGRLPRMQAALDVHLPESVRGERVEPPTTTLCRLEPLPEAGLRLDLAVRPIAGGPSFPPGEGPPEVLHAAEGRCLHAARALGSERERALHLARTLALGEADAASSWRWEVSDDGAALELLAKLRQLSELVELEWPAGEIRVDRAVRGALKVEIRKRRDWFGAEGGVEIDGRRVSLAELLAAVRAGRRYVKLDARRFAAIEDELRERLAALDDVVFDNQGAIELGLLAAPVLAELVEDRSQLDLAPAFRAVLGNLAAAQAETAALPEGLRATLRHYQGEGFRWLARLAGWGLGACLADDMGLGKTVQALALLLRRAELGPALVIAPTSVVGNWAAECARFAPGLRPAIYRGSQRAAVREGLGPGSLLLTSYAVAVRDADALAAIPFATLIVDEAQMAKNALTQRFRALRDLQADFRVALTGTPIENHLGELWAIFRLVTPGLLGSWEQFRRRFALPIERHHDRACQARLARVVRPFLLRRTKAEVAPELPPRTEMNQSIELGAGERRLYEAARLEVLQSLAESAAAGPGDEARQRIKILAALTRLRLLCCHPRLVVPDTAAGSAKLAALVELLCELRDEGHRVLVFSQFTSFLDLARPVLARAGLRTLTLDGSTPAAEREKLVRAFQGGEADAFLLSLRAGGTGLNLTAATYVVHLDPWWNPAVEDQATDRAHRIGQERPVTVIRLVARGTIEEQVLALHEDKRQLAASILDGADTAGRLDSEALLDLIRRGGAGDEAENDDENEAAGGAAAPAAEQPSL
ncbi:MAG: DEAD/DEAH box helicase [Deltaproteobacteria bacterium]|nr:DEAD/DEAH box helicase [Deltaproteobacteria bacterium]